jgi:2,5-diamino-6-(ribosylamino)-4(3H)-pyrimidinone 5'-phosphate reductase
MSHDSSKYDLRPYIIINCAMSADGKIALPSHRPIKLSSPEDFKRVHELRNYCDGILVGINTIIMDDPKLTVKSEFVPNPRHPSRIVLDTTGRIPASAAVLNATAPTFIAMDKNHVSQKKQIENAEIIYCEVDADHLIELHNLVSILKNKGIENLLVEGGETTIYSFLKSQLVDELYVYVSNIIIGGTTTPTLAGGAGAKSSDDVIKLRLLSHERLGDGILLKYLPV